MTQANSLSEEAKAVLEFHNNHGDEFCFADHLVGKYKSIRNLTDLHEIYVMLEENEYVEASSNQTVGFYDATTGQKLYYIKYKIKPK